MNIGDFSFLTMWGVLGICAAVLSLIVGLIVALMYNRSNAILSIIMAVAIGVLLNAVVIGGIPLNVEVEKTVESAENGESTNVKDIVSIDFTDEHNEDTEIEIVSLMFCGVGFLWFAIRNLYHIRIKISNPTGLVLGTLIVDTIPVLVGYIYTPIMGIVGGIGSYYLAKLALSSGFSMFGIVYGVVLALVTLIEFIAAFVISGKSKNKKNSSFNLKINRMASLNPQEIETSIK